MQVGILLIFQNYQGKRSDEEVVRTEMEVAELAEPLGYDTVWSVEHHFTDYSSCPDNLQFLSYVAARTSTIKLGTGAVIVPWNNPLRIAEKVALLDHMSNGRVVLGLGRGLSRTEYHHFGIDMSSSRERFDEAAAMIIEALDTGFIEGDGPYYPQVRTEIRPRPLAGIRDRLYAVGMSPESVLQSAELGARLMVFSQEPWEMFAEGAHTNHRKRFEEKHGRLPGPPVTGDLMFCHANPDQAKEIAMEYMQNYFLSIIRHYEIMGDNFKDVSGYDHYASASELFNQVGVEIAAEGYCAVQTWGTPDQILEKLEERKKLLGSFELNMIVNYGGMPIEQARGSLDLFSKEVLPVLKSW